MKKRTASATAQQEPLERDPIGMWQDKACNWLEQLCKEVRTWLLLLFAMLVIFGIPFSPIYWFWIRPSVSQIQVSQNNEEVTVQETISPLGSWVSPNTVSVNPNGLIYKTHLAFSDNISEEIIPKKEIKGTAIDRGYLWDVISVDYGINKNLKLCFRKDGTGDKAFQIISTLTP